MDSQRAIIGCDDTRALIFDMHSGRLIRSLPPNPGPVTALHVSKNDDFLITAGNKSVPFEPGERMKNEFRFARFAAINHSRFVLITFAFSIKWHAQVGIKSHSTHSVMKSRVRIWNETRKENLCDNCPYHNGPCSLRPTHSRPRALTYHAIHNWRPSQPVEPYKFGK